MVGVGTPTEASGLSTKMAHVYILKFNSGKYYVGSTVNLSEQLRHHRGGFTPSTRRLGTVELVFSQEYSTIGEARRVELKLKKLKRRDYLQKIIADGVIKMRG